MRICTGAGQRRVQRRLESPGGREAAEKQLLKEKILLKRYPMPMLASALLFGGAPLAWAAEHGEETNIFNADIGNFILTLIIFGLVVYILGKFAWKPLLTVLKERERNIRESLEAARREREAAEGLLKEYQARLEKARQEASAIVEEGRRDGEVVRRRIQDEARQQANEMIERARREIRLATDAAVKELYDQTAELAVRLAGGIVRKELSPSDHRRLIAESLDRMRSADRAKIKQ